MWKWSLLALGLGLLFAFLAWSGLRRRSSWRDGEKLWGQVAGVSVTPVWNGADSMDGDRSPARVTLRLSLEGREVSLQKDFRSPARVTLRLSLEGREVSLQKDFPKVLAAPALGQRVQVLYRRSTGEWALWKDVRSWGSGPCGRTSAPGGCCGRFWRQPLWRCFSCCCWEEEPWRPSSPTTP